MPNIDQWFSDPALPHPLLAARPASFTPSPMPTSDVVMPPSQIWPCPWAVQLVDMTPMREMAHSGPMQSPRPQTKLNPVRAGANIVHPDLTLPPALDPEIIKLDKWIPLLCETHH
jgi:hypothetical protein